MPIPPLLKDDNLEDKAVISVGILLFIILITVVGLVFSVVSLNKRLNLICSANSLLFECSHCGIEYICFPSNSGVENEIAMPIPPSFIAPID
jgi:hypothetical protein